MVITQAATLWVRLLGRTPGLVARAGRHWARWRRILAHPSLRWKRVRGPISALIAMLLGVGWSPVFPDYWIDHRGHHWKLAGSAVGQLVRALRLAVEAKLWRMAAGHYLGGGMEQGAWLDGPKKMLIKLKANDPCSAGCWPSLWLDANGAVDRIWAQGYAKALGAGVQPGI